MNKIQKQIVVPSLLTAILLVIAIFPIKEYDYYILLRWIVCFTAIFIAFFAHKEKKEYWMWFMGVTAVIFNPLKPIHLYKGMWQVIDFVAAVIFGMTIFVFSKNIKENNHRIQGE